VFLDISRGNVSRIYTFRDKICCKTSSKDKLWYRKILHFQKQVAKFLESFANTVAS
jgi:hypothetical protein